MSASHDKRGVDESPMTALKRLQDKLVVMGVRNIGFTWAPGAENMTADERAADVLRLFDAMERGDYEVMFDSRSPTPRTDAWLKKQGRKRVVTTFQDIIDLADFARGLEREIVERTPSHALQNHVEAQQDTSCGVGSEFAPSPTPAGASTPTPTRPIYTVEQLESWQQSFENLRREFHRKGNHDGQRGCEFALEAIRLYQTETPVSATACSADAKDAARYRWLRDLSVPPHNFYISVPVEFKDERYTPQQVDAAIDAAMRRSDGTAKP